MGTTGEFTRDMSDQTQGVQPVRCKNSAMIGLRKGDTITSTFAHFDGYLEWTGSKLLSFYDSPEKANELAQYGEIYGIAVTGKITHLDGQVNGLSADYLLRKYSLPVPNDLSLPVEISAKLFGDKIESLKPSHIYIYDVDSESWLYRHSSDSDLTALTRDMTESEYDDEVI